MCADGTRAEILDAVHRWFKGDRLGTEDGLRTEGNPQGQIFWLDGVAGTGKSTIAQTIAHHYHATGQLAASFFCSRGDADCSNVNMIFPTIAYQLCSLHPLLQERVSEAMGKNIDLQSALTSMQFEKLVVDPLKALMDDPGFKFPPCLVVIDALDECKDENATSTVLTTLSVFTGRFCPIRFFITSRPVARVQRGFRITGLMDDTNALVLHSIPRDISQRDIEVYLQGRLSYIGRSFGLKAWPSSAVVSQLVERSSGLFIFAATVANFVEDQNASDPIEQLSVVLSTEHISSTEESPYRHLDALYLTVLHEAFPKISKHQRDRLRTVLGSVVLLFDPLEAEGLEGLLGLGENTVRPTLHQLHSIAIVPDAGGGPVQPIHPSLHDFIVDPDRCDDVNFVVDAQVQHTLLAERCLGVLQTLSPDMCGIGDASRLNQDVADLPSRIAACIPAHVQYACRHWASHLSSGNVSDAIVALLADFCSNQLLNWLEVMSLLGDLGGAITALQSAHRIMKVDCFCPSA